MNKLQILFTKQNPAVICLQETFLQKKNTKIKVMNNTTSFMKQDSELMEVHQY